MRASDGQRVSHNLGRTSCMMAEKRALVSLKEWQPDRKNQVNGSIKNEIARE